MTKQNNPQYRAFVDDIGSDIKTTLQRGFEFINWEKKLEKNATVFVKPNFTLPYYKEGVTTSPQFMKCLLEILKSRTSNIIVGESDGGNHSFKAEDAFEGHDMYRICKEAGVELVNLSTLPYETVEAEILSRKVEVKLPKMLLKDIDCFISAPVLKIHVMTNISISIKNLWGCVPDTMRGLHHQNLAYKLALITKLMETRLVAIDGSYALNVHGPMFGEAVKTNLIITADNPVVADSLGTLIMGFSPQRIEHIVVAGKAGLGSLDLANSTTLNQDWEKFQRHFHVRKTLVDRVSGLLFCNDALAKLVMDSPLTPVIYKIAPFFKSSDEKDLSQKIGQHRTHG